VKFIVRLRAKRFYGSVFRAWIDEIYRFFHETCVRPRRIVELNTLGICGRLQPKLLKSLRREAWRSFPSIAHVRLHNLKDASRIAEDLALRFFVAPAAQAASEWFAFKG
jgi:hypothetical protein